MIGKSRAFKELSFKSDNYDSMLVRPGALLEVKDYDFVIGATINATFRCKGKDSGDEESFDMPAVAIECKTYLDKTMLESCSTTGEQLKRKFPRPLPQKWTGELFLLTNFLILTVLDRSPRGFFIVYAAHFLRSAHAADFVTVLVHILGILDLVGSLAFYPAEALDINHIFRIAGAGFRL